MELAIESIEPSQTQSFNWNLIAIESQLNFTANLILIGLIDGHRTYEQTLIKIKRPFTKFIDIEQNWTPKLQSNQSNFSKNFAVRLKTIVFNNNDGILFD